MKGKKVSPEERKQIETDKSKERIKRLADNVFKAIKETSEETSDLGEFTVYEVNDVLLRVAHLYNKRFLDTQFDVKDGK
jgi:hypothetical protein